MSDDTNTTQETPAPDPVQQTDSTPIDVPPMATEAPASSEDPVSLKDDNPVPPSQNATAGQGNEPLEPEKTAQNKEQIPETPSPINNPNITITKTPDTVTITEVVEPPKTSRPEKPSQKDLWGRFLNTLNIRKRKKLDKIMQAITEAGKITNDDVEKILHVSDATATRYLNFLEKESKIKQVGKTGKYTYYEKI